MFYKKNELTKFNINKKWSNKESYFYFLKYICMVQILDNNEKESETKIIENKVKPKNLEKVEKKDEPQLIIDFSFGKIKSKNNKEKNNIKITKFSWKDKLQYQSFEKCLENKNIKEYFILGEKITFEKFREKLSEYYKILTAL